MKHVGKLEGREWLPRDARIDVKWTVLVECVGGEAWAEVLNVSAKGFRLRTSRALEAGAEVELRFAKDPPVKAVVHWVTGNEAGGMFLESAAL